MITKAILLSAITASIAFTISHSQIFGWLRGCLIKCSSFLGDLVSCGYCLGYWITAALLIAFPMRLFNVYRPLDYILTWLAISWAAGLQTLIASWLWGD